MWLPVIGAWMLIVHTALPGRPTLQHEVQGFATQEACEAFRQQLATAYADTARQAATALSTTAQRVLAQKQRTSHCEERP
jgi:hypothetical protein